MKETLRQTIARLAADNKVLREQNSVLTTELAFAKARIAEGDVRAKTLIKAANLSRSNPELAAYREARSDFVKRELAAGAKSVKFPGFHAWKTDHMAAWLSTYKENSNA